LTNTAAVGARDLDGASDAEELEELAAAVDAEAPGVGEAHEQRRAVPGTRRQHDLGGARREAQCASAGERAGGRDERGAQPGRGGGEHEAVAEHGGAVRAAQRAVE
jgi:hypothetical protein